MGLKATLATVASLGRIPSASLLSAALLAGCNTNYPNPLLGTINTGQPGAQDDIVFTSDSWGTSPSGLGEVFSLSSTVAGVPRQLTFCNQTQACNTFEASSAPDRMRLAMRRVLTDTNGDGVLTPDDGEAMIFVDLSRGVEAPLVPQTGRVSGLDWSPSDGTIVYSGLGASNAEDLFTIGTNGQNVTNATNTPSIRERRPRYDPTASNVVFERIDPAVGKGAVWYFNASGVELQVDPGSSGTAALAGTPYVVGADADPVFSPDGTQVAFRRLTSASGSGGTWDIVTCKIDGTSVTPIVTGPLYRSAPDWGPRGIVFAEGSSSAPSSLVLVQGDGSGRRVLLSLTGGYTLNLPRWLPGS